MRITSCFLSALAANFVIVTALRADDEANARALVAKGIKAAGGEEKLGKFTAQTWKESGTYYGMGDGLPYTGNYSVQWPDKFKMEIQGVFTIVLNGNKGWTSMNGETREMTAEETKVQQDEHFVGWMATLLPLKDKKFKLATAGEIKVNERPAMGVRVSCEGSKGATLYFDKESGLLVKCDHRAISAEQGGKEVNQEIIFDNYKEISGAKFSMKYLIKRDNEKFVEAEINELHPIEKLDDSVFSKP